MAEVDLRDGTRTLAIIKPDAFAGRRVSRILQVLEEESGLWPPDVMLSTRIPAERWAEFYAEHASRPFFGALCQHMASGLVLLLVLCGHDAVRRWRTLLGATDPRLARAETIRGRFGLLDGSVFRNAAHGSDSPAAAEREVLFFFHDVYRRNEDGSVFPCACEVGERVWRCDANGQWGCGRCGRPLARGAVQVQPQEPPTFAGVDLAAEPPSAPRLLHHLRDVVQASFSSAVGVRDRFRVARWASEVGPRGLRLTVDVLVGRDAEGHEWTQVERSMLRGAANAAFDAMVAAARGDGPALSFAELSMRVFDERVDEDRLLSRHSHTPGFGK